MSLSSKSFLGFLDLGLGIDQFSIQILIVEVNLIINSIKSSLKSLELIVISIKGGFESSSVSQQLVNFGSEVSNILLTDLVVVLVFSI